MSFINFTRDPNHPGLKGSSTVYCKNMNALKITVDGVMLDSRRVCNVYKKPFQRESYVEMFQVDDNNKIISEAGKPLKYEVAGEIVIEGTPSTCGCWRGRGRGEWWLKIDRLHGAL